MMQFESFCLDTANECLWREGRQILLPPRPFMVLRYLVQNPGRLITHDELLDALWPETYVQPQVLRTYMLELRKLLGDDAGSPRFIQTLPKRGYCFVAPVSESSTAPGAARSAASGAPAPSRAIPGRQEELAQLMAQFQAVESGQRRIVFITGESGIGKTALVDAFAASHRCAVARGQCVEGLAAREEYYPVMEALGQLCASPHGEDACRVLARLAPGWLAAMGRQAASDALTFPTLARVPGDLCASLEQLAAHQPLLLVFEDLQWADASTLSLISALAHRRTPAKLMILGTSSGRGDRSVQELRQSLLLRQLSTEIALQPLSRTAVAKLLMAALQQQSLPPGLDSFVHHHSEGNPLFATSILEHFIARRFLVRREAAWALTAPLHELESEVPDRLAQMVELEIERLSPEEQRILGAGSVMGIAFPAWAVAAALEQEAALIEEACDHLAHRLHYVRRGGQDELPGGAQSEFYVFVHAIYRDVLYQRQPATRRAAWHLRIATHLAELFAGREAVVAPELARHYEAACEWQRACDALLLAGRQARERRARAEASQSLEHALRLAENLRGDRREAVLADIRSEMASLGS